MGIFVKTGDESLLKFLQSCLSGLQVVNDLFHDFITLKKYEVVFTGQLIFLKKYLNDQFDPVQTRIYVTTNSGILSPFFFRVSETNGDYVYRVSESNGPFIQRVNENISTFDFTVYVPVSLSYDATQFNGAIEKYKLADKTYEIQTF